MKNNQKSVIAHNSRTTCKELGTASALTFGPHGFWAEITTPNGHKGRR